jgi:hypothetical protein
MSTCHGLCRYTTDIPNNYFHRTFRAIPMGTPEICEYQVNDDLICLGFTCSLFLKFGRAKSPNFGCSCVPILEVPLLTGTPLKEKPKNRHRTVTK